MARARPEEEREQLLGTLRSLTCAANVLDVPREYDELGPSETPPEQGCKGRCCGKAAHALPKETRPPHLHNAWKLPGDRGALLISLTHCRSPTYAAQQYPAHSRPCLGCAPAARPREAGLQERHSAEAGYACSLRGVLCLSMSGLGQL